MSTATLENNRNTQQSRQVKYHAPEVNIYEDKDSFVLQADMPGVTKDSLELTLDANELTIVGHRLPVQPTGETIYRESQDTSFRRVFELDPVVDTSKISARLDNGVLTLNLPKTERVKPRKIEIHD